MRKIRFLLDADMPRSSAKVIKSLGYDVEDVRDIGLGAAKDEEIIEYALKSKRIIITRNTGFGEILRYPNHPGAIIFRLPYTFTVEEINKKLREFLTSVSGKEIEHAIIIVELTKYRKRSLK